MTGVNLTHTRNHMGTEATASFPLVFAWQLNGSGGGRAMQWPEVMGTTFGSFGQCWLHMNRNSEAARNWIVQRSGLNAFITKALLAMETRPRCVRHHDGAILYLRGINHNAGATFHDMVTVRIWADRNGVLSLRRRRMLSPEDIHESLATSQGPTNTGDLLVALVERLSSRMEPMLEHMRNQLEKLEHSTLEEEKTTVSRQESQQKRQMLGQLRISAVAMRRHLMPQREALQRLMTENLSWINDQHRVRLHELINDTTRHLEDLDEIRDTAGIIQDQITGDASAVMNDLLYKLTLVTVFFMPLSFLVGFFGSNVGGMFFGGDPSDPGQNGVLWETAILFMVSLVELLAFRLLRWI